LVVEGNDGTSLVLPNSAGVCVVVARAGMTFQPGAPVRPMTPPVHSPRRTQRPRLLGVIQQGQHHLVWWGAHWAPPSIRCRTWAATSAGWSFHVAVCLTGRSA